MNKNQLTQERIHALKLMADQKQLVPVVIDNKLCSHVHPEFAKTQIIQACDLDSLEKSNPFRFW